MLPRRHGSRSSVRRDCRRRSPIADKLNTEIDAALTKPDVSKKLAGLGFVAQPQSQQAFKASLGAEVVKWREITQIVGFSMN